MSLLESWERSPPEFANKHLTQIIGFAGSGKLLDEGDTSKEFREFLAHIPSDVIERYAKQAAVGKFEQSGFALQDIINEIGRRLGFSVEHGRYYSGSDGIWCSSNGEMIVVEVKITDTYAVELEKLDRYQREVAKAHRVERCWILIVLGRRDTGVLDAQIRGSLQNSYSQSVSVDSLLQLINTHRPETSPSAHSTILKILIPSSGSSADTMVDLLSQGHVNGTEASCQETKLPRIRSTNPAFGADEQALRELAEIIEYIRRQGGAVPRRKLQRRFSNVGPETFKNRMRFLLPDVSNADRELRLERRAGASGRIVNYIVLNRNSTVDEYLLALAENYEAGRPTVGIGWQEFARVKGIDETAARRAIARLKAEQSVVDILGMGIIRLSNQGYSRYLSRIEVLRSLAKPEP